MPHQIFRNGKHHDTEKFSRCVRRHVLRVRRLAVRGRKSGWVRHRERLGRRRHHLRLDPITDDNILGVLTTPSADPLLVLLAHSDSEGTIEPADALRLADRLTESLMPRTFRAVAEKFIAACRLATYRNEPMEFVWDPVATIRRLTEDALLNKLFANEMMQRLRSDGLSVH
jgi:hypothetical protein